MDLYRAAAPLRLLPSQHHQMLPPAWRWERASWLRGENRPVSKTKEDPWVVLAARFQKDLANCETYASFERLRNKYPGAFEAWTFFSDPKKSIRWTIEAYLCASATIREIAERTGEHVETVFCYANLFFDVAGKTRHRLYMINQVIGRSVNAGLNERDYDLLWKLFGLLKGPMFLDRFILCENEPARMTSRSQGSAMVDDLFKTTAENKALVAMATISVAYNQEVIFTTYQKMREFERDSGGGNETRSLITTNIGKMIGSFGFAVASPGNKDAATWKDNGVELRASELVERALGMKPRVKPVMALEHFPEPEKTAADKDKQAS